MTNRKKLLQTAEYDLLCKANENLLQALYRDERACIMTAVGEPNRNFRCSKYHPDCGKCIADWLNEEVNA
jgi:hypothetical protein